MASLAAILAIGKPVAFDASAVERRDPRVHLDHDDPAVVGSTANWMLQPPVSTPTARMMSIADVAQVLVLAVGQRHAPARP